jgi:hypothetical protein
MSRRIIDTLETFLLCAAENSAFLRKRHKLKGVPVIRKEMEKFCELARH